MPESVANVLHANGIQDRAGLANALKMPPSTVYRVFDSDWSGRATDTMLAALAETFNVPMSRLVAEPAANRLGPKRRSPRRAANGRTAP